MVAVHLPHMVMVTKAYEVDKIERTKLSFKILIFMYLLAKVCKGVKSDPKIVVLRHFKMQK